MVAGFLISLEVLGVKIKYFLLKINAFNMKTALFDEFVKSHEFNYEAVRE